MEKQEEYVSGIRIQDFPSRGRVSRIKGITTGRVHHLLTDLESNIFYLLDYEKEVVDIKEHYPLLDLFELGISFDNINLNKFKNKKTKEQYLFTTSFVVTINEGSKEKYIAISVKNESQLYKTTTQEKLEVERRYWKAKGIDWCILTNKDINMEKVENIKWLLLSDNVTVFKNEKLIEDFIMDNIESSKYVTIANLLKNIDELLGLNGEALAVFKNMIISNKLKTNLFEKITLNDKIERFLILNRKGHCKDECVNC